MKIRKTVTAAKAAANKENAKKSPGPTSARGKEISKRNATTHGIFTRDMLVSGESPIELEEFRREKIASYCPVGYGELGQVEIMVSVEWRLKRHRRAEAGEINKSLADYMPAQEIVASRHNPQYLQAVADLTKLEQVEEEIAAAGRVSAENREWLRKLPYGEPARDVLKWIGLIEGAESGTGEATSASAEIPPTEENPVETEAPKTPPSQGWSEPCRDLLLEGLNPLKRAIEQAQLDHGEHVVSKVAAQGNAFLVPQDAVLDRFNRYEDHLMRIYYPALHELERMQRLRLGDKVPPPSARMN